MTGEQRVIVVGASLAGARGMESLRRAGFTGRITLVGAETHYPPYDRPPLSKQILAGSWEAGAGRLRVDEDLRVDRLLGRRAIAALPYFWSDQHDWKVQFVGFPGDRTGEGEVTIAEGALDDGRFVAAYHLAGRLAGALCVKPAQLSRYRKRIVAEYEVPGRVVAAEESKV
jgi:NADPH-dependent 2,4-dienoyl-CoA reductase/sulfur reductase-like enzyme